MVKSHTLKSGSCWQFKVRLVDALAPRRKQRPWYYIGIHAGLLRGLVSMIYDANVGSYSVKCISRLFSFLLTTAVSAVGVKLLGTCPPFPAHRNPLVQHVIIYRPCSLWGYISVCNASVSHNYVCQLITNPSYPLVAQALMSLLYLGMPPM